MNFRSVLYIIGLLISSLGCMMFIPAMFDLLNYNEEWRVFASTGIISFLMGITIILAFRNKNIKIGSKETFLLSVLSWVFLAAISALPLYLSNLNLSYTLFNNWKNKRAVEVSKIQEEIAELNIVNMSQTLSASLRNLIELYAVRKQLVDISQENMVYAQKAFDLAEKRFDIGSINSIDLASFQNNYQNTMIQHYENLFNKMDTFLEIYKMTGKIGLEYN